MNTKPALPAQAGHEICPDCWVRPGEDHQLSCPEVSPALFAEYISWTPQPSKPSRRPLIRRYVVTARQPGHPTAVASRHLTLRAATRRADWLRSQSDYADADVRAHHVNKQEH